MTAEAGRVLHFDGSSWTETQLETSAMMVDIWAFGPGDMYMVGGDSMAHYDGSGWEITTPREQEPGIEGLAGIWGSGSDDLWVVGSQSTAAHWNGTSWHRYIAAGPDNSIVWGSGPNDVYVVGLSEIAHWDGSAWEEVEPGEMSPFVEGLWGFGPDDVWLTDGSGEMGHFDGTNWSVQFLELTAEASVLWGRAPNDLWGVGTPGGILHYDGSQHEIAHQKIGSPYLRMYHDVHGSEAGDVWIVGTELGEQGATPMLLRR